MLLALSSVAFLLTESAIGAAPQVEVLVEDAGCDVQSNHLGTDFSTPGECLMHAKETAGCGNTIMWSDSYNYAWGCRCCAEAGALGGSVNVNWAVYITVGEDPDTVTPKFSSQGHPVYILHEDQGCGSQAANLGNHFDTPEECADALLADSRCGEDGDWRGFMWSHGYKHHWGCRCCEPGGVTGGTVNQNWDVFILDDIPDEEQDEVSVCVDHHCSGRGACALFKPDGTFKKCKVDPDYFVNSSTCTADGGIFCEGSDDRTDEDVEKFTSMEEYNAFLSSNELQTEWACVSSGGKWNDDREKCKGVKKANCRKVLDLHVCQRLPGCKVGNRCKGNVSW